MTQKEEIALHNDLDLLKGYFNPRIVSIYRRTDAMNMLYRLKFVVNAPSFVARKNEAGPIPTNKIDFFMDILPGYPKTKPLVYYGDEEWLFHINTHETEGHPQCTGFHDSDGEDDIVQLAEKTIRAIIFDPAVRRFDSMASSTPCDWQKRMEEAHKLPTINPALLLRKSSRRKPQIF